MRAPAAILIACLLAGCSLFRSGSGGGGSWKGPHAGEVRAHALEMWQAEGLPSDGFNALTVTTAAPVALPPRKLSITESHGSGRFVVKFRATDPPGWLIRHEAAHIVLLSQGTRGHPRAFGRKYGLSEWHD